MVSNKQYLSHVRGGDLLAKEKKGRVVQDDFIDNVVEGLNFLKNGDVKEIIKKLSKSLAILLTPMS